MSFFKDLKEDIAQSVNELTDTFDEEEQAGDVADVAVEEFAVDAPMPEIDGLEEPAMMFTKPAEEPDIPSVEEEFPMTGSDGEQSLEDALSGVADMPVVSPLDIEIPEETLTEDDKEPEEEIPMVEEVIPEPEVEIPMVEEVIPEPEVEMPEEVPEQFDFSELKDHPVIIKVDVGASTYYSEIASIQTLENLLMQGQITVIQFLERLPDDYIPQRMALISELKNQQAQMMQAQQAAPLPAPEGDMSGGPVVQGNAMMDIPTGSGNGTLQRTIMQTGDTKGLV